MTTGFGVDTLPAFRPAHLAVSAKMPKRTLRNECAMFRSTHCAKLGFAALWILLTAGAAHAQSYPTHLIRIIVPFAAGGLNDTAARLIQPRALGQTVIVENRPAASGR